MASYPLPILQLTSEIPHYRFLKRPNHPDLKLEQKRVQNKNASRRAKKKKMLKGQSLLDTVRNSKLELENVQQVNQSFEWKLYQSYYQDLYPNAKERSPYGPPDNFFVTLNHWKVRLEMASPMANQLGYKKLIRKINKLKRIILSRVKPPEMSRGTFGSKKTRAKMELPVVEMEMEHWKLEFLKKTELKFGLILSTTAKTLNNYLRVINGAHLVEEKILY